MTKSKLRQIREGLGLSQVEAAVKAGISVSQYWKAETGKMVSRRCLCKIARAFGVRVDEVLDDSPPLASGR